MRFAALEITHGKRVEGCTRPVTISHRPDTPPAAPCRARTNSTQQAELATLEGERVARFHRRRSGSPVTPPADASSRWGARLNDCSTSRGALDGDMYARRLPTAALFAHLPLWWFKGHQKTPQPSSFCLPYAPIQPAAVREPKPAGGRDRARTFYALDVAGWESKAKVGRSADGCAHNPGPSDDGGLQRKVVLAL